MPHSPFKSVSISGLTITNGRSSGVSFDGHGGGIFNDHATLTVGNCTVSGNLAAYGGAGICNNGYLGPNAALQIVNSTFTSNSITQSGGVVGTICNIGDGNGGSATLQVLNSTFSGNLATGASAGGCIRNEGAFGSFSVG